MKEVNLIKLSPIQSMMFGKVRVGHRSNIPVDGRSSITWQNAFNRMSSFRLYFIRQITPWTFMSHPTFGQYPLTALQVVFTLIFTNPALRSQGTGRGYRTMDVLVKVTTSELICCSAAEEFSGHQICRVRLRGSEVVRSDKEELLGGADPFDSIIPCRRLISNGP
jgi:hypothetical protein